MAEEKGKTGIILLGILATVGFAAYFLLKGGGQPPIPPGEVSANIYEFSCYTM